MCDAGGQMMEEVLRSVESRVEVVIQEPREGKDGTAAARAFDCRQQRGQGLEYVQAVDITVNQQRIQVFNVYDQKMPNSNQEPAEIS